MRVGRAHKSARTVHVPSTAVPMMAADRSPTLCTDSALSAEPSTSQAMTLRMRVPQRSQVQGLVF